MPKVGLRILKSALAVFLCFVVYLVRQDGMPFYSAIAAVLCMQPYVRHSFTAALNRTVGTLIGGAYRPAAAWVRDHLRRHHSLDVPDGPD